MLSPQLFELRKALLKEATKYVSEVGFTYAALTRALSATEKSVTDTALSSMFERGFPIALVEFLVKESSLSAQKGLEATFSKNAVIGSIAANEGSFREGRFAIPSEHDVVRSAIEWKLEALKPYCDRWPEAVALEYLPGNVPFTVINMAEFVDTTAYYMERMENMRSILQHAQRMMQAKAMASYIPTQETGAHSRGDGTADFLRSFLAGIPLAEGPHNSQHGFSIAWYARRGKIAAAYSTAMASLMGDESTNSVETKQLTKTVVNALF